MTSEIRANTLKNRVGLGTVSFTNTGPVVSGIVTATSIEVVGALNDDAARIKIPDGMNGAPFTGNLEFGNSRDFVVLHDGHHNYVKANTGNVYITCGGNTLATLLTSGTVLLGRDLDVNGHTNLDNVSIAGVTTITSSSQYPLVINGSDNGKIVLQGSNAPYIRFKEQTTDKAYIQWNNDGYLELKNEESNESLKLGNGSNGLKWSVGGADYTIWNSTNMGTGGGLDADKLDGQEGSYYITTISGNANNRVITGSGTANTLNGESTLTYDGDGLLSMTSTSGSAEFTIVGPSNTDSGIYFNDGANDGAITYDHSVRQLKFRAGGHTRMYFAGGNDNNNNVIYLANNSYDDGILQYYNGGIYLKTGSSNGDRLISFYTAGSQRVTIDPDGDVGIGDNNPNIRLTVVDSGTENLVRIGRSDASGHASHTVNVKASKDFYHNFKMEASSFNLDTYNGSAMIEAFKVHNTGFAELAGAADVRFTVGNYGTAGSNGSNWIRGYNANLYYNAAASDHLWEIAGAEHMRLKNDGNLYLRSESANYVVLGSNGSATSSGISNNMNWIRGNGANTQYNTSGGFHAWEVSGSQKLILSAGGDLGLNAANPASRLCIHDTDGHNLTLSNSWSGEARIGFTGGNSSANGYSNTSTAGALSVTASAPGGAATGYMSFYTNVGDNLLERLRIDSKGSMRHMGTSGYWQITVIHNGSGSANWYSGSAPQQIYPNYIDNRTGYAEFIFEFHPSTSYSGWEEPTFVICGGDGGLKTGGTIELNMNRRTNSPNNATFRSYHGQYSWQIYNDGDGDVTGGQREINRNVEHRSSYWIDPSTQSVDYIHVYHSNYNTNAEPLINQRSFLKIKMNNSSNTSYGVQGHPFQCRFVTYSQGDKDWFAYMQYN